LVRLGVLYFTHKFISSVNIIKNLSESIENSVTERNNYNVDGIKSTDNTPDIPPNTVTTVTSVTSVTEQKPSETETNLEPKFEKPERCSNCGNTISPFDKNIHPACCKRNGVGVGIG
jgi:hypothetical protein